MAGESLEQRNEKLENELHDENLQPDEAGADLGSPPDKDVTIKILGWVLTVSSILFVVFLIYLTIEIAHKRSEFSAFNVAKTTSVTADPATKKLVEVTSTNSSNLSNIKELFPLVTSSVFLLGFMGTVYQLRLTQISSQTVHRQIQSQLKYADRQLKQVQQQINEAREQRIKDEKWKRTEFITEQLLRFSKDRSVVNAKRILEAIDSEFNERLQVEVVEADNPASTKSGEVRLADVEVTNQQLLNAFTTDPDKAQVLSTGHVKKERLKYSQLEIKIGHELDAFFVYLIQFQKFLNDGLLTVSDMHPHLYYWLSLILEPAVDRSRDAQIIKESDLLRKALQDYVTVYFNGVPGHREIGVCYFVATVLGRRYEDTPFYVDKQNG